jgi:Arc/MetJ-type ribon-helix-helix transcriptional regulator
MKPKPRRLDGRKINILLSDEMGKDLRRYCADRGIESQSELVRQAIAKYIYADYRDETLKLQGISELKKSVEQVRDMLDVLFKYSRTANINVLAYHPEIDENLADAAFRSAVTRHKKMFEAFQDSLRNDPPFFEMLLHRYYQEKTDEQV